MSEQKPGERCGGGDGGERSSRAEMNSPREGSLHGSGPRDLISTSNVGVMEGLPVHALLLSGTEGGMLPSRKGSPLAYKTIHYNGREEG